ncbi:hypothetical protein [Neisseria sp. 74A18]|uniref:hypothetical protein n=1 Tax=Neisseria sp. 74A18 TaxID=1696094 RepID=UPI0006CAE2D1|nr:hypothetical protein [Neisseria sp. 74A18]KPN73659.1 hypothetical protein AKG43_06615 [Neisseria sp. 74A18]
MKHEIDLVWGLPLPGGGVAKRAALRPLTIGGELRAQAALEDMDWGEAETESGKARALMVETLAYWAQQLTVEGIAPNQLTAEYLAENLTGEDYGIILAAQDDLRAKYTAAGANPGNTTAAAERPSPEATETATAITDNPSS